MADAGFFRGTSADQDNRFSNKEKKLLKTLKFEPVLETKVDLGKVKLEPLRPWITKRVTELLGVEDDLVIDFVFNQLEESTDPDPKKIQLNLTGFLHAKNARIFMGELWEHLVSAQEHESGISKMLLEQKKQELLQEELNKQRIQEGLRAIAERAKQTANVVTPNVQGETPRSSSGDRDAPRERRDDSRRRPDSPDRRDRRSSRDRDRRRSRSRERDSRRHRRYRSRSRSPDRHRRRRSRTPSRERRRSRDRRDRDRDRDRRRHRDSRRRRSHSRSPSRSPPRRRRSPSEEREERRNRERSASPSNGHHDADKAGPEATEEVLRERALQALGKKPSE